MGINRLIKCFKEVFTENKQKGVYPCYRCGFKPHWIDSRKKPYRPQFPTDLGKVSLQAQEIYTPSLGLSALAHKFRGSSEKETLMRIWEHIVGFDYKAEDTETWRFPQTTSALGKGDCEDTTILFVTLAQLAGVSPSRIFNACGLVHGEEENFGHSYPIYLDPGKHKFYIYETTYNQAGKPLALEEAPYTVDWGVANGCFAGKLRGMSGRDTYYKKTKKTKSEERRKIEFINRGGCGDGC